MPSVAIISHLNLPSDDVQSILQAVDQVSDALTSAGLDVEEVAPWARQETAIPTTATGLPNLLQVLQQQSQTTPPPTQL